MSCRHTSDSGVVALSVEGVFLCLPAFGRFVRGQWVP